MRVMSSANGKWQLKPQENAHTDIVLLGHSMGGLLAAEVVLQPAGTVFEHSFRHRILGTLNFDTPFLGMHLGMIRSGIASFFRPAPEPQSFQNHPASEQLIYNTSGVLSSSTPSLLSHETPKRVSTPGVSTSSISPSVHSLPISDPDYNPPFQNDIRRPVRTGFDRFIYFSNKHSGALRSATKEYFISHLEFGGCLGDFRGLKRQYARIRGLEDVATAFKTADPRLRFLNIYTASTGRIKRKKHSRSSDTSTQTLPSQAAIPTYLQQPSTPTNHNPKPIRDKIFCIQPSTVDGKPDPCWPRIFMEGVDEIDAHCGLFFPGKHYEGLLELVVGRLESWVVQNSVGGEGA
ncbi:alpha/beta-Hydrolase [Glarea lozoyensis ATCC 20868]|uniref:Alpha/beta-Hydrolase n=1 Tax=Glarea lozoyensis (strain ATCC 20868 / MF5171) TaxID=1116229 RepID=S3D400_GLAL2|nr:alpha/beta-Hydrolase [Glarea lozoyensis ATCC 20868]EPE33197.1 alpha/beta-Hydrolase [Glarea lozoyensis ATCC 20868]